MLFRSANLVAGGSVGVNAHLSTRLYDVAGGLAVSGGGVGVGATLSTVVVQNNVGATMGRSGVVVASGFGSGITTPDNRQLKRHGIIFSATASETVIQIAIAAAATGGNAGIGGVVNTMVVLNHVNAAVGDGTKLYAGYAVIEGETDSTIEEAVGESADDAAAAGQSDVIIRAIDNSFFIEIAGALGGSSGVGVGASVVVMVFDKNVSADAGNAAIIQARRNVSVTADSDDSLWLLGLALGACGTAGVAGGVNAMVFQSKPCALVGGAVTAQQWDPNPRATRGTGTVPRVE